MCSSISAEAQTSGCDPQLYSAGFAYPPIRLLFTTTTEGVLGNIIAISYFQRISLNSESFRLFVH